MRGQKNSTEAAERKPSLQQEIDMMSDSVESEQPENVGNAGGNKGKAGNVMLSGGTM